MSKNQLLISHPWHGIAHAWNGKTIQAVIEIPKSERCKFEIDKTSGLLRLDRVLSASFEYPVNYGFVPQTLEEDGDPLDILVLSKYSLPSLCLVNVRVLGILLMKDRDKLDHKLIGVADKDVTQEHLLSIDDLSVQFKNELLHFFKEYTVLENKKVEVEKIADFETAVQHIGKCIDLYRTSLVKDRDISDLG
ncbi:MAG: inorganic diphosphatase [Saprospiraceae bacterium]|nr:inorganic diphosphatase [Saprospiraceae bacterium]